MSTLKVGAVRGVSASSDAITVANDGSCTANITNRPNRNILINGDMRICQRSTSTTSINAYIVDRWRSFGGPLGLTISQVSDATNYPQSQFALRLHRTAGNSQTNNVGLGQGVETLDLHIRLEVEVMQNLVLTLMDQFPKILVVILEEMI